MRIVFMGTPDFACAPLERLYHDGHDVAGVFTQPDKPRNRGGKVSFSPVKEIALKHASQVYQPESLRGAEAADIIHKLDCELIAVVAYGKLLPRDILDIPPLGCVNIHASLLPKYRGAAPIQWAVLNGEHETGVTSMYMGEELDAGDIILYKKTPIDDNETAGGLHDRLSVLGAELLSETIIGITSGNLSRLPQNHGDATLAPPLNKEMSPIDWNDTAYKTKCKIRGLNPWPSASTEIAGIVLKILTADINAKNPPGVKPGDIISAGSDGIEIACADMTIVIKELQAPGGRRMSAAEYVRGHDVGNRS